MKKKITKLTPEEIESLKGLLASKDVDNHKLFKQITEGQKLSLGETVRQLWPDLKWSIGSTIRWMNGKKDEIRVYNIDVAGLGFNLFQRDFYKKIKTGEVKNHFSVRSFYTLPDGEKVSFDFASEVKSVLEFFTKLQQLISKGVEARKMAINRLMLVDKASLDKE